MLTNIEKREFFLGSKEIKETWKLFKRFYEKVKTLFFCNSKQETELKWKPFLDKWLFYKDNCGEPKGGFN